MQVKEMINWLKVDDSECFVVMLMLCYDDDNDDDCHESMYLS